MRLRELSSSVMGGKFVGASNLICEPSGYLNRFSAQPVGGKLFAPRGETEVACKRWMTGYRMGLW